MPLAANLDDLLEMTAFDMPGHGRSADWQGSDDIQLDVVRIAKALMTGPSIMIGHSFGATAALRLAVMHPELVRALVLIEPVFYAVGFAEVPDSRAAHEAEMAPVQAALSQGDYAAASRLFLKIWGQRPDSVSLDPSAETRLVSQMPLLTAAAPVLNEDAAGLLRAGGLDAVSCPTLLVEGASSPAIIPAINAGLARRLTSAERIIIKGAGHMVPLTDASVVGGHIRAFLGGL